MILYVRGLRKARPPALYKRLRCPFSTISQNVQPTFNDRRGDAGACLANKRALPRVRGAQESKAAPIANPHLSNNRSQAQQLEVEEALLKQAADTRTRQSIIALFPGMAKKLGVKVPKTKAAPKNKAPPKAKAAAPAPPPAPAKLPLISLVRPALLAALACVALLRCADCCTAAPSRSLRRPSRAAHRTWRPPSANKTRTRGSVA